MIGATPRQSEMLMAIKAYQRRHGHGPSVRDLMLALGVRSPNAVQGHLLALEKKGLVLRNPGKARSIVVVDDGMVTVERAGLEMAADLAMTAGDADVARIIDGLLASAKGGSDDD